MKSWGPRDFWEFVYSTLLRMGGVIFAHCPELSFQSFLDFFLDFPYYDSFSQKHGETFDLKVFLPAVITRGFVEIVLGR